jgi:hypothetical protein
MIAKKPTTHFTNQIAVSVARSTLTLALLAAYPGYAQTITMPAPSASVAQTTPSSPIGVVSRNVPTSANVVAPYTGEGDSIDLRAKRAKMMDEAKVAAEVQKLMPPSAAISTPSLRSMPKSVSQRPEFYVEAIRGFEDQLEAALVINNKRVTGSKQFPTLADGWNITSITVNGVVIAKGKERQALAFVGPEPYQVSTNRVNDAAVNPQAILGVGVGAMPSGMPMPVGR